MTVEQARPAGLRIGIFIALLPPEHLGGAELQADRLARELAQRGHAVHIFARRQPGHSGSEWRDGVHVHRRPVLPVPGLRLLQETAFASFQAARQNLDVLLCYITLNSAVLGYATRILRRVPYVIWQRGESECVLHPRSFRTRLVGFLNRHAAAFWVQSQRMVEKMEQEYLASSYQPEWPGLQTRIRILGNGVDLAQLHEDELPPRRFVFVGRLVEEKNLFLLLDAMRQLKSSEPWIVGTGPLAARLESAAADIGGRIRFLGSQPHERIPDFLRQSRALVLSSKEEGLPNVAIEPLAQGRPVVSTHVGGLPELITDGVNGRLVESGDVEALSRALHEMEDDNTWRAFARAAQPSIERFGWPELVRPVESELAEISARVHRGGEGIGPSLT